MENPNDLPYPLPNISQAPCLPPNLRQELLSTSVVDEVSCEDFAQLLHSEAWKIPTVLLPFDPRDADAKAN